MTRFISPVWLDEMLETSEAEWATATVHAYLLEQGTAYVPATDLFLADIPGGDRIGPTALTGMDATDGFFTADPIDFALAPLQIAEWCVIVRVDGGGEAASPVIGSFNERGDGSALLLDGGAGGMTVTLQPQAIGIGRI